MNIHTLYRPISKYFRTKRMREFESRFHLTGETRVLDIGGTETNWSFIHFPPQLTLLNIFRGRAFKVPYVTADGRYLPFKDKSFDVVYSNSVIEHLHDYESQKLFASECRRVGLRLYVQTPNKWFPIEPHYITPFIHWVPSRLRARLLRNFTLWGMITRPTPQQSEAIVREIRLLEEAEMRQLFPDAEIWKESLLGLTKSIIAARQ